MRRRSTIGTVAAACAVAIALASPASAAADNWSGEVDSGGKLKYFSTQRVTSGTVSVYVRNGPVGGVGVQLIGCADLQVVGGEKRIYEGRSNKWESLGRKCFRMGMKRWLTADTNGILPGNGVTDVSGSVTY